MAIAPPPTETLAPPRARRGSPWATARNLLVFAAAWAAVTVALYRWLPQVGLDGPVAIKMAHFRQHKDEYDTLFFGSSLVYRGIVPAVFDAETAKAGQPTRSFNFGFGGMQQHEANALLAEVLALEPKRLKTVFVELGRWECEISPRNRFNRRMIAWHTWPETRSAVRSVWLRSPNVFEAVPEIGTHLLHMLAHYTRAGQGPRLIQEAFDAAPRRNDPDLPLMVAADGYVGHTAEAKRAHNRQRRENLIATKDTAYEQTLQRLMRENAVGAGRDGHWARYNVKAVNDQVAALRARGVEPIYMVLTHLQSLPELKLLAEHGHVPLLFAYNDPARYPQLYEFETRFDWSHPIHEGAVMFTELLARDYCVTRLGATADDQPAQASR